MMKKLFILLIVLLSDVFAFNVVYGGIKNPSQPVFCGREGNLYPITEPDMWKEIVKKAKDVNQTFFYNLMKREFNKAFIVNNNLPYCSKLKVEKFEPIYIVKHNMYVNGRLLYPKGYMFNILQRINQLKSIKPLLYFGDLDNNVSKLIGLKLIKKYKTAIFSVLKGNIKKLAYKHPYQVAKADKILINKFHIKCDSTVVIMGNRFIYLINIPVNKLKKKNMETIFSLIGKYYKEYYK